MDKKKNRFSKKALALFGLTAANLLFFLTLWLAGKYDRLSIDQLLYQIKSSAAGTDSSLTGSAVVRIFVFGLVSTAVQVLFYLLCSGRFQRFLESNRHYIRFRGTKLCRFVSRRAVSLVLALLMLSVSFFTLRLDVISYAAAIATDSSFIENHYVPPENVTITFPEQKRNLVYIFLESMEVTFSDPAAGEPIYDNYIPELTALAQDHINFSHTDGVGGALSYTGTTWTAAALVSQTSGTIVQVPLRAEEYGGEDYIPGLVSLGEILAEQGYVQSLLFGSDADFGGRETYFTQHGGYDVVDIHALKEQGRLDADYRQWWGFEDEKLFAYAREEVTRLAQTGQPFNFTMLTADTHFPNGYVCRLCREDYDEQYPNVLRCSSRQVYDFLLWLRQQPFYENTTVILCGDHLTMDPKFLEDLDEGYNRTVYNCILNSAVEPVQEKNRLFGTFDMFPTTLAALGASIEGERLGLGTNLFSGEPTLSERYGFAALDGEFRKNSDYYNDELLELEPRESWITLPGD